MKLINVNNQVRTKFKRQVNHNINDELEGMCWDHIRVHIWNPINDTFWNQVWHPLWIQMNKLTAPSI